VVPLVHIGGDEGRGLGIGTRDDDRRDTGDVRGEAGTGYFDVVSTALNPDSATLAVAATTETAQFH